MKNVLKKLIVVFMVMVFIASGLPVSANRDLRELRRLYEEAMEEVREREGELAATRAQIDQIAQELRSQYNVGYTPTNPVTNGGFRKIEIRSKDGFKIQSRSGYFAVPNHDNEQ